MRKFLGWVLGMLGLLWLSVAGVNWKTYVYTHFRGQLAAEDWGYMCGAFLPGLLLLIVGYVLSEKQ
jgi:hypothetical protein